MTPYTVINRCRYNEALRKNWRGNNFYPGNKNYHRKRKSRIYKKIHRQIMKNIINKEMTNDADRAY
jgi:hypothetical protein